MPSHCLLVINSLRIPWDRSIVPRPPQDDRVELSNEFLLREELTPLHYLPHCLHMAVDSLFTWSDDRLKTKWFSIACSAVRFSHGELSHGKPHKVEPDVSLILFQGVGKPRFAWFQFPSDLLEPACDELLRFDHFCFLSMEHHTIVGVTDEFWCSPLCRGSLFLTHGRFHECLFHSRESHVGKEWRNHPALRCTRLG